MHQGYDPVRFVRFSGGGGVLQAAETEEIKAGQDEIDARTQELTVFD